MIGKICGTGSYVPSEYFDNNDLAQMVERTTEERLPVIIYACSGGARMQEGLYSLMQMAETYAILLKQKYIRSVPSRIRAKIGDWILTDDSRML